MRSNTEWQIARLGDIASKIGSGATPKGGKESYHQSGISLIRSLNVYDFMFEREGLAHIDDEQAEQLSNVTVEPEDILLNITGASVARCCMVPQDILPARVNQHVAILRIVKRLAEPAFVFYSINSAQNKSHLLALAQGGATREALTKDTIEKFEIRLPAISVQKRIAAILSAYDNLIESNIRRMKILGEIAQMICREWFVNFRFPGHERLKMVESEVGPIPIGWRAGSLREMCESIDYGHTASAVAEPIGPKFLRITDIVPDTIDWFSVPYCARPDRNPLKYRLLEGDIVIARTGATTGYAKRLNKRHPESIFASYLVRLRVKPEHSNSMVGLLLESDDYKRFVKANLGGAAQPQANAQVLTSKPVAIPPSEFQTQFFAIAEPLLDQKEILQIKNANLRQTRDLLLPRLVSGEMSLEHFQAEAAAQSL
jgi:type I restriction enzyme S subunit